jgi:hypothetical protein
MVGFCMMKKLGKFYKVYIIYLLKLNLSKDILF